MFDIPLFPELAVYASEGFVANRPLIDVVLDLSRRHLHAIDERIQQLTRFREQLASEIRKWDGEQEPTCRGLCQIIVNAEDRPMTVSPITLHVGTRGARSVQTRRRQR